MKYKTLMEGETFTNSSQGTNAEFRGRMVKQASTPLHKKLIENSYTMNSITTGRIRAANVQPTFKGKKQNFNLDSVSGVIKDTKGIIILTRNGMDFFWEYVTF